MLKFFTLWKEYTKAFCKCVERLETHSKYPLFYIIYTSHPEIILGVFLCIMLPHSVIHPLRLFNSVIYPCCFLSCTANASSFVLQSFCYIHTMVLYYVIRGGCVTHIFGAKRNIIENLICFSILQQLYIYTRTSWQNDL